MGCKENRTVFKIKITKMKTNKKKILFVNGHLKIGGIEKTLVDLLNHIDYSRYDVDLLLLEGGGEFLDKLPASVNVILFDNRKAFGPFGSTMWSNLKRGDFTLIAYRLISLYANSFGRKHLGLLRNVLPIKKYYDIAVAYRTGHSADIVGYTVKSAKKLVWWHNGEFNLSDKDKSETAEVWSKFDRIVAVSEGCKHLLVKHFLSLSDKMCVMYNILDAKKIATEADVKIKEMGLNSSVTKIVTLGNLSIRKHVMNAVIATKKLVDSGYTNFHWTIVGDGPERGNLEKMIKDYNVGTYIELVGGKANPYPYIKNADMMVHTSYGEAHCTAILEAMILKVPCVVTETYIPQDFTIDGETCYMAEQNVDSLYNCIVRMLNHPENTTDITERAFEWVKRYAPERIVADFYQLVE